jgi:hypothetical protein
MGNMDSYIGSDFDEPILFRTANAEVREATLTTGSLWLRSDQYYRQIEDRARRDDLEGVSGSRPLISLRISLANGPNINIVGDGHIGQRIVPHYILSLYGSSISEAQLRSFGGFTFGIRSISKLSAEILYRASLKLKCVGYRYGAVSYRYATLALSQLPKGGEAMCLGGTPPVYLNPMNTEVLSKQPIMPFIEQDEWRIVVFTEVYVENDPSAPLQLSVATSHFYSY